MTHVGIVWEGIQKYLQSTNPYKSFGPDIIYPIVAGSLTKSQVSRAFSTLWDQGKIIRGGTKNKNNSYWYRTQRAGIKRAVMNQNPDTKPKGRAKIKTNKYYRVVIPCQSEEAMNLLVNCFKDAVVNVEEK